MRNPDQCNHFWQVRGPKGQRWHDNHAWAQCRYCQSVTVVEFGTLGPCKHAVGMMSTEGLRFEEPPLEQEQLSWREWLERNCDPCRNKNEAMKASGLREEAVSCPNCREMVK